MPPHWQQVLLAVRYNCTTSFVRLEASAEAPSPSILNPMTASIGHEHQRQKQSLHLQHRTSCCPENPKGPDASFFDNQVLKALIRTVVEPQALDNELFGPRLRKLMPLPRRFQTSGLRTPRGSKDLHNEYLAQAILTIPQIEIKSPH